MIGYSPPKSEIEDILREISAALKHSNRVNETLFAGDLSFRLDIESIRKHVLLELMKQSNLYCLKNSQEFTYSCKRGNSTIDLFFSNTYRPQDHRKL